MSEDIRKVNIIGHLNPDTDSICAAISYAYLKNQLDESTTYEARRAGSVNRETAFALRHFGFEEPRLITTVSPQIKDLEYQKAAGISGESSLFVVWSLMREMGVDTLCITDANNDLEGLINVKDIAAANLDVFDRAGLASAETSYINIMDTLGGKLVVGDPSGRVTSGSVCVGSTPESMEGVVSEGDTVLVTDRYESQVFAVESGAKCLIVCCGAAVSDTLAKLAAEHGCAVIATDFDTYDTARLISMSVPVRAKMVGADKLVTFSINTAMDDARATMSSEHHRFYPVLGKDGKFDGIISSENMINPRQKHVILVDHAELSQTVEGMEQADILEVVDHHRVGTLETVGPVYYRAAPVGCTCTIVYDIFQENGIQIPANIAGLMMSAILSDTLCFRSPTCTPRDEFVGRELAKICGEDPDAYADAMFDAGADLTGRTAEQVFNSDFKVFSRGDVSFGVGQGSYMTDNSRRAGEDLLRPYFPEAGAEKGVPMIFYMFTDIKTQTTEMLYWGEDAEKILSHAFGVEAADGMAVLPGVVSRKKQVIPALMKTLQALEA